MIIKTKYIDFKIFLFEQQEIELEFEQFVCKPVIVRAMYENENDHDLNKPFILVFTLFDATESSLCFADVDDDDTEQVDADN